MRKDLPIRSLLWPAISAAAVLAAWHLAVLIYSLPGYLLPLPHAIVQAAVERRSDLLTGFAVTGGAALTGLLLSALAGFVLATLLAWSRGLRLSLFPYVLLLQTVPVVILTPLLVIWIGPGFPSVTAITFLITFFPVVSNTVHGMLSAPRPMLDLMRTLQADRRQEMFLLRVPHALPHYFSGLRIAATLAPIGAIAGEFFAGSGSGGSGGLGYLVIVYFSRHETDALFATGLLACLMGILFHSAVVLFRRLLHSYSRLV
jgi:NitT/TauT family transport system permease protein